VLHTDSLFLKLALSGGQLCTRGSPARGRRWPSAGPRRPAQFPLAIMLQPPAEVNMTHNSVHVVLRIARPRPSQAAAAVPRSRLPRGRSAAAARVLPARCDWRRRGGCLNCADGRSRCHLRCAYNWCDGAGDVRQCSLEDDYRSFVETKCGLGRRFNLGAL
jgi:hypothetical protein